MTPTNKSHLFLFKRVVQLFFGGLGERKGMPGWQFSYNVHNVFLIQDLFK